MATDMRRNRRITPRRQYSPENAAKSTHLEQIYGFHPVAAALANPARGIYRLLVTPEARKSLANHAAAEREIGMVECRSASRQEIDAVLPPGAVHQGIVLECDPLPACSLDEACAPGTGGAPVILLDQVKDPHNIGAILRSAAAFGARAVVIQERHSPSATGALAKAASGALETVPLVRVANLARAMRQLKDMGYWLTGLDSAAETQLGAVIPRHPVALVLGAEGSGLRRLTRETCDSLVAIPVADSMHSLNVSNAAAVALYQLTLNY